MILHLWSIEEPIPQWSLVVFITLVNVFHWTFDFMFWSFHLMLSYFPVVLCVLSCSLSPCVLIWSFMFPVLFCKTIPVLLCLVFCYFTFLVLPSLVIVCTCSECFPPVVNHLCSLVYLVSVLSVWSLMDVYVWCSTTINAVNVLSIRKASPSDDAPAPSEDGSSEKELWEPHTGDLPGKPRS